MGITKTELYDQQTNNLANILKALAHPARITVIQILGISPKTNSDLVQALSLTQATVSNHLRVLKEAGFIRSTASGPYVIYSLDDTGWHNMKIAIDEFTVMV